MSTLHAALRPALGALRSLLVLCLLATVIAVALPKDTGSAAVVARAARASGDYRVAIPGYRWRSCATIGWKYNPQGQPVDMLPVLQAAFRKVSRVTGLQFRYQGRTARSAARHSGAIASTQVLISWAAPRQSASIAGARVGATRTYADPRTRRYQSAAVVLDRTAHLAPGFTSGGRATWGQVALHEIGHVIGLAHAAGSNELMNRTLGAANHQFGAGDVAGFRRLGRRGTCG